MKPLDYIKLPVYTAQLATGAKSFAANPVLASRRLNRMGLHVNRVKTAMQMAAMRRRALAGRIDANARAQYEENGFIVAEDFLPDDVFAAISREIATMDFQRYDMRQGSTVTRRSMIDDRDLDGRGGLRAARTDRRIADLIRYVASTGGQPLLTLQTVFAVPSPDAKRDDPQTLVHSDTFHPTAKAWLFLHDVGEDDGPFSYVAGSHRMTPERLEWERHVSENIADADNRYTARGSFRVEEARLGELGYKQPVRMTVKANTLVVADTHGFHARSPSPGPTTRIELYGSLRRNPFLPWTGVHVASLPPLRGHLNRITIDGLRRLSALGLRANPWKDAGTGSATEWPPGL